MSSNYNANQYNEPFIPKRLRNWNVESAWYDENNPNNYTSQPNAGSTCFVANDDGHLFPHVYRNACTSPWGDYPTSIWEILSENHFPRSYKTDKSKRINLPKFYKNNDNDEDEDEPHLPRIERPRFDPYNSNNNYNSRKSDPIIQTLREAQVPIIWIVGLPTKQILHSRRRYAKQLAEQINFTYINLDEQILKWKAGKLEEEEESAKDKNDAEFWQKLLFEKSKSVPVPIQKKKFKEQETTKKSCKLSSKCATTDFVRLELSQSLTCIDFQEINKIGSPKDKNNNKSNLLKLPLKSILKPPRKTDSKQKSTCTNNNYKEDLLTTDVRRKINSAELPKIPLASNTTKGLRFTRDKILELYKYAMIEYWPQSIGYIIEGYPYDVSDATHFETMFYPVTLGIYFTESAVTNKVKNNHNQNISACQKIINRRLMERNKRLPTGQVEIQCLNLNGDDDEHEDEYNHNRGSKNDPSSSSSSFAPILNPIGPRFARRNKSFSFSEAQKLCDLFGSKIIRVINAESILLDTMGFVNAVINKYLNKLLKAKSAKTIRSETDEDDLKLEYQFTTESEKEDKVKIKSKSHNLTENTLMKNNSGESEKRENPPEDNGSSQSSLLETMSYKAQQYRMLLREKILNQGKESKDVKRVETRENTDTDVTNDQSCDRRSHEQSSITADDGEGDFHGGHQTPSSSWNEEASVFEESYSSLDEDEAGDHCYNTNQNSSILKTSSHDNGFEKEISSVPTGDFSRNTEFTTMYYRSRDYESSFETFTSSEDDDTNNNYRRGGDIISCRSSSNTKSKGLLKSSSTSTEEEHKKYPRRIFGANKGNSSIAKNKVQNNNIHQTAANFNYEGGDCTATSDNDDSDNDPDYTDIDEKTITDYSSETMDEYSSKTDEENPNGDFTSRYEKVFNFADFEKHFMEDEDENADDENSPTTTTATQELPLFSLSSTTPQPESSSSVSSLELSDLSSNVKSNLITYHSVPTIVNTNSPPPQLNIIEKSKSHSNILSQEEDSATEKTVANISKSETHCQNGNSSSTSSSSDIKSRGANRSKPDWVWKF